MYFTSIFLKEWKYGCLLYTSVKKLIQLVSNVHFIISWQTEVCPKQIIFCLSYRFNYYKYLSIKITYTTTVI